ncbi:MAG: class I SAM-dependent methyltransferase [Candidatus Bathyarchaeota archaeon]|nr:class I SAM-dependent methyltransferase [Candidatus Bathyarchaeota archaeon]
MVGEGSLPYDPRHWHNIQPPEFMDVSRRFEYDEDHLRLLKRWLRLDSEAPRTIVEVGCGSGFFTEKLVKMAPGSEIVGVEPDDVLRGHVGSKGLPGTRFVKGTAESIPLPSAYSDLTICHIVLNNLPDVPRAVREMARVTKRGGIVAAVEPIGSSVSYIPDPRLNELGEKASKAFGMGVWKPRWEAIDYSKDLKNKQARYPEVFRSCGLEGVEAHGLLSVFLLSDPRRDRDEIAGWLKDKLDFIVGDEERSRVILERGGLEEPLIEEYHRLNREHLQRLIEDPEQISNTHELETVGRIVTVGFKKA